MKNCTTNHKIRYLKNVGSLLIVSCTLTLVCISSSSAACKWRTQHATKKKNRMSGNNSLTMLQHHCRQPYKQAFKKKEYRETDFVDRHILNGIYHQLNKISRWLALSAYKRPLQMYFSVTSYCLLIKSAHQEAILLIYMIHAPFLGHNNSIDSFTMLATF